MTSFKKFKKDENLPRISDGRISFAGLVCQACISIQSLFLRGELDILSTLR